MQICNYYSKNRKSANFLGVPVRKFQIRKFARKKTMFLIHICIGWALIFFFYVSIFQTTQRHVTMYLRIYGSFKSSKKLLVLPNANPQIAKIYGPRITNPQLPHLRKVRKKMKSANLGICILRNLFADRLSLQKIGAKLK